MKAEIIWILKSICSGRWSCEQLNCTLKAMFPDSKIVEAFSMGRTKSMYMINHGRAPFLSHFCYLSWYFRFFCIFLWWKSEPSYTNLWNGCLCTVLECYWTKSQCLIYWFYFFWPWNTSKIIKTFLWSYQGVGSFEIVSDINGWSKWNSTMK